MAWITPVFDRVQSDIDNKTAKGYMNVADWNRIRYNIDHIHTYLNAGVLGRFNNGGWTSTWDDEGPVIVGKTNFVKSRLAMYDASDKGLIASEVALRCVDYAVPPRPVCSNALPGDFVKTKTSYIPQAFAVAIKEGIHAAIWYDLSGSWLQTALLDIYQGYTDGFWAFKTASELFKDTAYIRDVNEYPGVAGYAFQGNGREIWLIWSHDGDNHNITLPSKPNAAYDVLKKPVSIPSVNYQVNIMPVYLEW